MAVLVTGGTGVIGSHVLRELIEAGEHPVVFANVIDKSLISDIADRVKMVQGDILDLPQVYSVFKKYKIRAVVHLAGLMMRASQHNPPLALDVNVKGTVHLLEAARFFEIDRFVFSCSKGIYGERDALVRNHGTLIVTEEHLPNPQNVYDATKYAAELLGRNYERNYGITFLSLRFGSIYGPGKLVRHGPMAVTSRMIENALCGIPTVVQNPPDARDDMIYVKDAAHGVVCALLARQPKSRVFNIGTGIGITLRDFAEVTKQVLPHAEIAFAESDEKMPAYHFVFDIARSREELGYAPRYGLKEGIEDYIAFMQRFGIEPTPSPPSASAI